MLPGRGSPFSRRDSGNGAPDPLLDGAKIRDCTPGILELPRNLEKMVLRLAVGDLLKRGDGWRDFGGGGS